MRRSVDIDDKDRAIISLLSENPELSQSEIAEKIGISQPSVGIRIKKLKEKGALAFIVGTDFKKSGLYLAKIEISAKNTTEIIEKFKDCPYFVNGLVTSGRNNLCFFFMGEDIATIDSIVDTHLRNDPNVKDVKMDIVVAYARSFVLPIKVEVPKTDKPPCGSSVVCRECLYYITERCLGCPSQKAYRGSFWK